MQPSHIKFCHCNTVNGLEDDAERWTSPSHKDFNLYTGSEQNLPLYCTSYTLFLY